MAFSIKGTFRIDRLQSNFYVTVIALQLSSHKDLQHSRVAEDHQTGFHFQYHYSHHRWDPANERITICKNRLSTNGIANLTTI